MKHLILVSFLCAHSAFSQELKELPPKNILVPENCTKILSIENQTQLNKIDSSTPANLILVSKAKNKIFIMYNDTVLYAFHAAFGSGYSDGAKAQEGDNRTPEGTYHINGKNPQSKFYKAIQVSYPSTADVQFAQKYNVSAGGDIMIHGISNSFGSLGFNQAIANTINLSNWTAGCIAIRNDQIDKIYNHIKIGTRIEICPL
jgi:murein L,D-transpeptidase YafK